MELTLETVLEENNPLLAAYYIMNNPLTCLDVDIRIKLLKALNCKGIFKIPYQSFYASDNNFTRMYPINEVYELITTLDGSKPYIEQVNQSTSFTEEQKALLRFILPL